MFVKKSTHDAVVAELDRLTDRLAQVRDEKRVIGAALKEALAERDEVRAKLSRYTRGLSLGSAASAAKRKITRADFELRP